MCAYNNKTSSMCFTVIEIVLCRTSMLSLHVIYHMLYQSTRIHVSQSMGVEIAYHAQEHERFKNTYFTEAVICRSIFVLRPAGR